MNKRQAIKQIAQSEAVLQIVNSRSDAIVATLASSQRHSEGLQTVLDDFVKRMAFTLSAVDWHSKLFRPDKVGTRTAWLLIAPDYSGADRSVVSYRDLFFEKAVALISKSNDTVVCIGTDAVDLAVSQGYQIAYSDSAEFLAADRIEELSGFLARLFVDMAIQKDFDKATMLYLGPQQSVRHGLLPFEDYEGASDALSRVVKKGALVYPDAGRFVVDSIAVFVSMAIAVALARAGVFAQTARYQGLQQTKERVDAEKRRLLALVRAIDSMKQQDEQNSASALRRSLLG